MDAVERIRRQFEARHGDFDRASRWASDSRLLAAFVEAIDARHHQVLDVCCGTGQVGGALATLGTHVVGVDLSPHMLMRAAERVAETVCADAASLPFPDGSFERITLRQAWHFLDRLAVPLELLRVATPGAILVTGQIVPFGPQDAEHVRLIHAAKQPDLRWFPTEESLVACLEESGWIVAARREVLVEEEMGLWLEHAPETGERAPEVLRLVREAPEAYRRLHRVREDAAGLWDTFRWEILTARKPGATPRVAPELLEILRCPRCGAVDLMEEGEILRCPSCAAAYPVDAGVPRMRA